MNIKTDYIIIGAGIYGLYAAYYLAPKGKKIVVLEYDSEAISRATYINQARVHNGYHYPRSFSTAIKSASYFNRFNDEFSFAVNKEFCKIYAISKEFSLTSGEQFEKFCKYSNIPCEEVNSRKYFKSNMVDGTYLTQEYAFDAMRIKAFFIEKLKAFSNVEVFYGTNISSIENLGSAYKVALNNGSAYVTDFILNATYASTNQILEKLNFQKYKIKYEICEIILCDVSENISNVGITVMDGPFFSTMPFGYSGKHSLTSVTFTPHVTCYDDLPTFECQQGIEHYCTPQQLGNCNYCPQKPATAWNYMSNLAKKYLNDNIILKYSSSLFSMKPILTASEIDDSRPTVIKAFSTSPTFISVLSGKINTIYDIEEVLE